MTQEEKWQRAYNLLKEYNKKHGDTRVPRDYVVNGVKLGKWVDRQRRAYKGNSTSKLTPEKISKLDEIGMIWEKGNIQVSFEYYYKYLEKYYKENGNIDIPHRYEIDGLNLGNWFSRLRRSYKTQTLDLTEEQLDKLNKLGMKWEIRNIFPFDIYYSKLEEYYKEYGDINVPQDYEVDGLKLGVWVKNKREAYKEINRKIDVESHKITQEEIDKLNKLGMVWRFFYENWTENFKLVLEYYEKHGNIDIPYNYVLKNVYLGYWLYTQRKLYKEKSDKLGTARILKLNKLGIDWNEEDTKFLNETISDMEKYKTVLIERLDNVLRDIADEENYEKICSLKKQKQIEKELIKRIWR